MVLSEVTVKRPVFATVLSLLILLLGAIAYLTLAVREYPDIDEPVVSVTTRLPGASAALMETDVTTVLEDALAGIEGIRAMSSTSREQLSEISITFALGRDPDGAAAEVRDRVGRVRGELPEEADEPIVAKVAADSQPIIWVAFWSDRHTLAQITDYVDRSIKDELQRIDGVAEVQIYGERRYAMRLWLKTLSLASFGLTPEDVENALRRQNLEVPGGRVESRQREFSVRSDTELKTVDEFNNIILRNSGGVLVRLSDVGRAALGVEDDRVQTRYRGGNSIGLGLVKQSVANPLEISLGLRKLLPQIQSRLPEGMQMEVAYDSSVFIERSIENVYRTIAEAVALVLAVIFLFLRSGRSTLVPLVTIPVSLIGTFAMMSLFGFSINTLTLLALVLAVGLVVDDAIVMLENIHRHVEEGMEPIRAALVGAREIGFAVVAMTFTLAAVFVPVVFLQGRTGRLFTEFALTLAGAVLISGFVALTLSPMMSGRLLRQTTTENMLSRLIGRGLDALDRGYRRLLLRALDARLAVVLVFLFTAAASAFIYTRVPAELAPTEDQGVLVGIAIAPEGATVDYTDAYMRQVEALYATVPEIDRAFVATGTPVASQALSFVLLKPWEERQRNSRMVAGALAPGMFGIPGVIAFPITLPPLGANPLEKPVTFIVRDSRPYAEIGRTVDQLLAEIAKNPGFRAVETDLKINTPQLTVTVDRDLIGDFGIDVAAVGRTIETMLGGREVTKFKRDGKQYDVIVQMEEGERATPEDMYRIFVRTAAGEPVPLSSVATIGEIVGPRDLNHFNRSRAVKITANLAEGYSLGEALTFLEQAADRLLPPTASYAYDGQSLEFKESGGALVAAFLLALVFIYLVLAAQFESFVDPLIILVTVPLSLAGALLALQLTGNTINIYSQIGLITLVGLITKHGILITEFANQQQERGVDKFEAVVAAAALRLRPILMTTAAMVLGAVPLALADGAGAESRHQIGWVIIGGLSLGTLLTLFVVPVAYSFIARDRKRRPTVDYAALDAHAAAG